MKLQDSKSSIKQQLVTFLINDELFGIDIRLINEVNPNVDIIPIPLTDSYIRGHINVRGQVILVLDLYVIFGKNPRPVTEKSHIVIFKTMQDLLRTGIYNSETDINIFGNKSIAMLVDEIGDVMEIDADQIETPTQNLKYTYSEFTEGIVKLKNKLLIIVNPVKVLKYSGESSL